MYCSVVGLCTLLCDHIIIQASASLKVVSHFELKHVEHIKDGEQQKTGLERTVRCEGEESEGQRKVVFSSYLLLL